MPPDSPAPSDLYIMFIDDEPGLCRLFVDEFTAAGVWVKAFTDPAEAIVSAHLQPPDLLFVDYRMPRTNGDAVAQALPASVRKYLITGDLKVETAGVFLGVFEKPMDFFAISEVIEAAKKAKAGSGKL